MQCEECGVLKGHLYNCSIAPIDYKIEQLNYLKNSLEWHRDRADKLNHLVTFWQGKFHLLRHENNKLRKKLRDLNNAL